MRCLVFKVRKSYQCSSGVDDGAEGVLWVGTTVGETITLVSKHMS